MSSTTTIDPGSFGITNGSLHSNLSESGSTGEMASTDIISRPLRRALRGLVALIQGSSSEELDLPQQDFFEKLKACEKPDEGSGFNRFQRALRRVRGSRQFSPTRDSASPLGRFGDRHIIGESSKINGGVYIGVVPQEAVVIDDRHGGLERIYNQLVVRLSEISLDRTLDEKEILPEIAALVVHALRFDESAVRSVCEREEIAADDKVAIDMFIHEGIGSARHQVLVAAYLIERLRARNLLQGFARIDSVSSHLLGHDEKLSYTSPQGYFFVFDPIRLHQGMK